MRKLIAVAAMVLSTTAVAQPDKDWWACQVVHSSGMRWENNQWVTTTFQEDPPFVLMSDGNNSLTNESVAKAIDGASIFANHYTRQPNPYGGSRVTCDERTGTTLFFDFKRGKGAIGRKFGSVDTGNNRDTPTVDAFECSKG